MISSIGAIICLIIYGVSSNACDPTLSGMSFSSPYINYMRYAYINALITHPVATGNECNCGTIEYVWSELTGTTGIG